MHKSRPNLYVVIVAHGSRDPYWKAPFQDLMQKLKVKIPDASIVLTFMEFETPYFVNQIQSILDSDSNASILVVPAFFSSRGHVANEIRPLILILANQYPHSKLLITEALGARKCVIQTMAEEVHRDIREFSMEMVADNVG